MYFIIIHIFHAFKYGAANVLEKTSEFDLIAILAYHLSQFSLISDRCNTMI